MPTLSSGKIAEVIFENALETYEHQMQMLKMVATFKPGAGTLQNAGNVIWRNVQQHAPILTGFDLTGQETEVIEETYPAVLGDPKNDFFQLRVDDLRDMGFWERRGRQSGLRQATELNKAIADLVKNTGSMFFDTNATSGYDAIAEAQALMNERQLPAGMRYVVLNDRDTLKYGKDLAARQTLQGRPAETWNTGQIGSNVAEFDVYTGSFLSNLTGGADPATTVTADQSFKPEGGSVNPTTLIVTNVDYRTATIPVTASASYNIGDKIEFRNTAVAVKALGLADKTDTNQAMTFTIVSKPTGTSIEIFPKPIALDDPALTVVEAASANIDTQILNLATVNRLNTTTKKVNIFWDKESIEVLGGDAPVELLNTFGGQKVVSSTMSNGQIMYMAYDGEIDTLNFKCRLFTWYGLTNANPSANGVFTTS